MKYRDIEWPDLRKIIPEGRSGDVAIAHDVVTEDAAAMANQLQMYKKGDDKPRSPIVDFVKPGPITRLAIGGTLFMTDAEMEKITSAEVVIKGKGRVLIAGLGLGMVLHPLAAKEDVYSIVVVEKNLDVIKLVGPTVPEKVRVVHGDIFEVSPTLLVVKAGGRFDTIFFDIWPHIATANLPDMARLHRRFAGVRREGAWMSSWLVDFLRQKRRRDKRRDARGRCDFSAGGNPLRPLEGNSLTCKLPPWA